MWITIFTSFGKNFHVIHLFAWGPVRSFPPTGAPASLANAANAVRASGSLSTSATPRLSRNFLLEEKNTNAKIGINSKLKRDV